MHLESKKDYSVYYYIVDSFSDSPFITVTDEFPDSELVLPTIAVISDSAGALQFEMGNSDRLVIRQWYIEIFAKTKQQRDEIAFRIMESLYTKIPVYDYDEGFPPDVSPTQLGVLDVKDINIKIIRVYPELTERMHYRSVVYFSADYASK